MSKESRIKLEDSTFDAVSKMCDGNPGAMSILMELLSPKTNSIDTNNPMGGLGYMLLLDTFGIYGTDIYVLGSDICGRNIAKMIAVLKATQLGLFDAGVLKDACHRQDYSGRKLVPADELYTAIQKEFPEFGNHESKE